MAIAAEAWMASVVVAKHRYAFNVGRILDGYGNVWPTLPRYSHIVARARPAQHRKGW
jgi:hypothetical protein